MEIRNLRLRARQELVAIVLVVWQGGVALAQCAVVDWFAEGARRAATTDSYIETDGPTFTRASTTVPTAMVQLESRYLYSSHPTLNSGPQLDLRVGLAPCVELRAEWSGVDAGPDFQSVEDLEVGFKFALTKGGGWIPTTALVTELLTPTGYGANAYGTLTPEIDYIYSWVLPKNFGLSGSTGTIVGQPGETHVIQVYQSLVLSRSWLDQRLITAYEWYSFFNAGVNQAVVSQGVVAAPSMDGAVLWRPAHNVQFDWRAGFGLNGQETGFYTGVGLSLRY